MKYPRMGSEPQWHWRTERETLRFLIDSGADTMSKEGLKLWMGVYMDLRPPTGSFPSDIFSLGLRELGSETCGFMLK